MAAQLFCYRLHLLTFFPYLENQLLVVYSVLETISILESASLAETIRTGH